MPSAEAIAIRDGRIVAVGSNSSIRPYVGLSTRVIDVQGRVVLPGFIDCHNHLIQYGLSLSKLQLRVIRSIEELKAEVRKRGSQTPPGAWIQGRGWDQDRFQEKRYPSRFDLDEVAPKNPVVLSRICGHILVANSLAFQEAGITSSTPDPESGQIDRDPANGEPTGILRENATDLVWRVLPKPSEKDYEAAAIAAMRDANRVGLTSVHCIIDSPQELRVLQQLHMKGKLTLRFYVLVQTDHLDAMARLGLGSGFGNDWVKIGSLKVFADGSLGARTAALNEPYNDDPSTSGIAIYPQEALNKTALTAHDSGLQLAVHAIGDRAISMALNALEPTLRESSRANSAAGPNPLRHRIEHASVLSPALIERIRRAGIIASVQPHFIISDYWIKDRLGRDRARYSYPLKSLLKAGIKMAASSDCPVEPLDPLLGVKAAVTRNDENAVECLEVLDALRLYTSEAAYASFEEDIKGAIEPGKFADLVVLSADPREIPPEKIDSVKVETTMVGATIVHVSEAFSGSLWHAGVAVTESL